MRSLYAAAWAMALLVGSANLAIAQGRTATAPQPGAPASAVRLQETSLTLQQVVARQEAHYNTIKMAEGTVVWQDRRLSNDAPVSSAPPTRVIHFAFAGGRAVTLVLPWDEAQSYALNQGKLNWSRVLSAALVTTDTVSVISMPTSGTLPEVHEVPFNPAVHDNNPLVAFHLRQVGDERIPLRELAAASARMPTKPRMSEFTQNGKLLIRIDFTNANSPDEDLYYIIDPIRGYIPMEIGHLSKGKYLSRSLIVIGQTADKTWIPARRTTTHWSAEGKQLTEESWYYEHLSVNEKLPPQTLSLLHFNLPSGTKVYPLPDSLRGALGQPAPTRTPQPAPSVSAPLGARSNSKATPTPGARRYY